MGNLLGIEVQPAERSDRDGARSWLEEVAHLFPWLRQLWADPGSTDPFVDRVRERLGWTVEIAKKLADPTGFIPLPRRWGVERSFAWDGRYRRLAKDYEFWGTSTESLVYAVTARLRPRFGRAAGYRQPRSIQRVLYRSVWDEDAVRDDLRAYVVAELGDPEGVLVVDETGFLKKGPHSVGIKLQYSGTAGKLDNCQLGIFLGYASAKGWGSIARCTCPANGPRLPSDGLRQESQQRSRSRPSHSWRWR
jgi:hypothetical protein